MENPPLSTAAVDCPGLNGPKLSGPKLNGWGKRPPYPETIQRLSQKIERPDALRAGDRINALQFAQMGDQP